MRHSLLLVVTAILGPLSATDVRCEELRVPVTRDNWFSNVGAEAEGNNGAAPRLKLKSNQEMSVIDIDPGPLRGWVITGATVHLRSPGEPRLRRVTVGSVGADWVEGTATNYTPEKGSSSHNHRQSPGLPWTIPGSDLCSVILGQAGTLWRMADASNPDAEGWQTVPVHPSIVAARVAGVSTGFLLFDDTGSEWTREGEQFTVQHMPNRFIYSRDQNAAHAPYLTVVLGEKDTQPPGLPTDFHAQGEDPAASEARVSWKTPPDKGASGTVGFFAELEGKPVPRYLVPAAGKAGETVHMHLRDLNLVPGKRAALTVRAVDGAGNVGPPATSSVYISAREVPALPALAIRPLRTPGPLPKLGTAEVAVIDELDKVQPVTGELIPSQGAQYLSANHLWNAGSRTVRLFAARNEFVAFQIVVRGAVEKLEPELFFPGNEAVRVTFSRYQPVATNRGPLPDPIVPLGLPTESVAGQTSQSVHCELYVPHNAKASEDSGTLRLKAGGKTLEIHVLLRVWNFTLPDSLSFLPEMNCYGLPENERDYYRLAHQHRTVLNRVPYYQNGRIADGCAPAWDGKTLDWPAWDRRFGPYLDGTAFRDLPRSGVPIESFYLPIHENWPTPMEGSYNGDYWADRAFTDAYRARLVEVSRQFAEHLHAKRWNETLFQFFLNGKLDFKRNGWSRGSSPWLLDEPANFQDYWALRYFGTAFHEGIGKTQGSARLLFRCDISRPQWQRNTLDGLLDYNVVGGAVRNYTRMVLDRKEANGEIVVEYGSSNAIEDSNLQAVGWCLDAWSLGLDGVLPWQTIGTAESWKKADSLALFYPGRESNGPIPSIRLKAYRRGQQDVEYLTLFGQETGQPRWAVGQRVREALQLAGKRAGTGSGGEDAGLIRYDPLRAGALWALRTRIGEALSSARPAFRRKLVDFRTPPRDLSRLAPGPVLIGAKGNR